MPGRESPARWRNRFTAKSACPSFRRNYAKTAARLRPAQQGNLPELITRGDLHADLHMHTNWSDGDNSIREMALEAIDLGHQVIAICDHSPLVCRRIYGKSIDAGNHRQQKEEILKIRGELEDKIRIVHGIEVDIRPDGTLDLEDEILQQFELVIASLHTAHDQPRETITDRLIKAIRHPCVKIIAHPSGRDLPGTGAEADWEQVFKAAVENNKVLEINSNPHHLDLNDRLALQAAEMGAKFSIDTDAHRAAALVNLEIRCRDRAQSPAAQGCHYHLPGKRRFAALSEYRTLNQNLPLQKPPKPVSYCTCWIKYDSAR
jgi:Histidinol phosphatase and related hydrolases of the PHP family